MNAIVFAFLAAGCASSTHFIFRKSSLGLKTTTGGYLVYYYLFSFIFSSLLSAIWRFECNWTIIFISGCVGILNVLLMQVTARAIKSGPSGLTFAFQNAGAVFPGVLLFLVFGAEFGYSCSYLQMLGMLLVLVGLFLGARHETRSGLAASMLWIKYAIACFILRILALTFMQGRCVLHKSDKLHDLFLPFALSITDDAWFLTGQFGVSLLVQMSIFKYGRIKTQNIKTQLLPHNAFYGLIGGVANAANGWFLLLATKYALPYEQSMIFPLFAVATIFFSSIWSHKLYGEKLNLLANCVCACGIFLGVLA